MKEGLWQVSLAVLAILVIIVGIFFFPKTSEANEILEMGIKDRIRGYFPSQEQKDARDKFEEYFSDFKDEVYKECIGLENVQNCWCTKERFELFNGFDMVIKKEGDILNFEFYDGVVDFDSRQFQNFDSCLITEHGDFTIQDLENEEFRIESKGDSAILKFKSKNLVPLKSITGNVAGVYPQDIQRYESEFELELDLSLMFFKANNGDVCIVDKKTAEAYEANNVGKC